MFHAHTRDFLLQRFGKVEHTVVPAAQLYQTTPSKGAVGEITCNITEKLALK